jgi:hypothetical protein
MNMLVIAVFITTGTIKRIRFALLTQTNELTGRIVLTLCSNLTLFTFSLTFAIFYSSL